MHRPRSALPPEPAAPKSWRLHDQMKEDPSRRRGLLSLVAGRRREVTEISLPGHHVPLTNSHFWTPRWTPWGVHIVNPPRTLLLSMQITEADHGDEFDKVCWVEGAVVFTKQSNVGVSIEVPVVGEYFAFALGREEDQVR